MNKKKFSDNSKSIQAVTVLTVLFVILTCLPPENVQGQVKDEGPINCEYLKKTLDDAINESANSATPTPSGLRPFTIFVIAPGNKKDSNSATSARLVKALYGLLKTDKYKSLRYTIVEAKPRKGFGHLQIYFMDGVKDLIFDKDIFVCP